MKKLKTLDRTSELTDQVQRAKAWLKGKESTYCEQVWVEALGEDVSDYDLRVAHRVSIILTTYCNWAKGGNRSRRNDGRQHWLYYPSKREPVDREPLDLEDFDPKAVRAFIKNRAHSMSADIILKSVFAIDPTEKIVKYQKAINRINHAFRQGGWVETGEDKKVGGNLLKVFKRAPTPTPFDDILG